VAPTRTGDADLSRPFVSFIGHRVTTDGSFAVETHALDGEIICKERAIISVVRFIRDKKKFESLSELKEAIKKDIAVASKELQFLQL